MNCGQMAKAIFMNFTNISFNHLKVELSATVSCTNVFNEISAGAFFGN